ncbi:MAG: AAA family ATPase [Phycisphaerae bacterium]
MTDEDQHECAEPHADADAGQPRGDHEPGAESPGTSRGAAAGGTSGEVVGRASGGARAHGGGQPADTEALDELTTAYETIRRELATVIVGQDDVIEQLLVAMLAGGHCILEGVPGLAKTLMISTLARCLALSFSRIQFTPDLMPSDITGTEVIQEDKATGARSLRFLPGPVFANVILADEINRTPPKTQAALLEAMQERQVTVGGVRHDLAPPFFVLATQNPIEQEGTYPLPEAQQDRFMFKVFVDYPSYDEEYAVAQRTTTQAVEPVHEGILAPDEIIRFQHLIRRIPAAPDVIRYALDLVRATRPDGARSDRQPADRHHVAPSTPQAAGGSASDVEADDTPARARGAASHPDVKHGADVVARMVTWGAGPRAVQALVLGGKARAALSGRHHLSADDIRAVAHPVLRHRIVTNFSAEAQGYDADRIIDILLERIDPNHTHLSDHDRYNRVLSA